MDTPLYLVTSENVEAIRNLLHKLYPYGLPDDSLLNGEHQLWNAALSLMVIQYFLPEAQSENILQKFVDVRFAGRFQKIEDGLYADIAHNQDKVRALSNEIIAKFPDKRKIFVIGLSDSEISKRGFFTVTSNCRSNYYHYCIL